MVDEIMPLYFGLGELVSAVQQKGFYHKDMQLCNIGVNHNGDIAFVDYEDMEWFLYPDEIDINKMSRCLMPLLRERSFEEIAMFRLGYICSGGHVSEIVFRNLYKKELSSIEFWADNEEVQYDALTNRINYKDAKEWKKYCIAENIFSQYYKLEEFEKIQIRENLSKRNKFFLDKYFLSVYFYFFVEKEEYSQLAIILANLGLKEYFISHMATAYIYFELFKELNEICKIANKSLLNIIEEKLVECKRKTAYKISSLIKIKRLIIQERYDLAQIDWITYDLENIILKQECKKYT